jgi:quercetin dioxygenase-like cupin family protein
MSTQLLTTRKETRNRHEQRITPNGTLFEFLVSPSEAGAEICLIRGTIPPGAAVPLHSHADVELFYILEGSVEAFQVTNGASRWTRVDAGHTVTIVGNTSHALRNTSALPATIVIVTTSKLYQFFHEVTKRFDPSQSATTPTPDEVQGFLRTVERYGYWMGSPEENAAIGLTLT